MKTPDFRLTGPLFSWMVSLIIFSPVHAQESWNQDSVTSLYGADDYLFSGSPYLPSHPGAEGIPYYPDEEWQAATIWVRDLRFEEKPVRLNVETGELIILFHPADKAPVQLSLSSMLIDSFSIGDITFLHSRHFTGVSLEDSYVERIYEEDITVVRLPYKHFQRAYNSTQPGGAYSDLQFLYFIQRNNEAPWESYPTFKALLKSFPESYKEVRKAMRSAGIPLNTPSTADCEAIISLCHDH